MPEASLTALQTFATTVTGSISATDVLTILGYAVTAGVSIFVIRWGARRILRTFMSSLNGHVAV